MTHKANITKNLSKLELLANTLANTPKNTPLHIDGMYFVLSDVIEEIKNALEGLEEKSSYTAANHAA